MSIKNYCCDVIIRVILISIILLSATLSLNISFASSTDPQEPTNIFILRQLIEIQNELKEIRKEMTGLREAIKQSRPTATAPRTNVTPQPSTLVDVQIDQDDPVLGSSNAKVAVVEFTDYECPFCSKYHTQTFPGLKKEFVDTGKVQYILRDFPLGFHAQAKGAAIAANCAGKQNKYWEMNDLLFAKQRELGDDLYQELSQSLGLYMEAFTTCQKDPQQEQEVTADVTAGKNAGVRGTPTFLIGRIENGKVTAAKRIAGAQTLPTFSQIIKPLLEEDGK